MHVQACACVRVCVCVCMHACVYVNVCVCTLAHCFPFQRAVSILTSSVPWSLGPALVALTAEDLAHDGKVSPQHYFPLHLQH